MEQDEEVFEKTESKKNPTAWLVKCSHEQKEILQKKAAESGKSVAQFLLNSVQMSAMKEVLNDANKETQKEFLEIDNLIERLNHLIYAKVYTLIEKEKMAEDLKTSLTRKENECQKDYQELKNNLTKEMDERREQLKNEAEFTLVEERQKFNAELSKKEQELMLSIEKVEQLEIKCSNFERDKNTLQKQYTESMRSYEIADERLMEFRLKIKELEEKLKHFEATREKNNSLEKEVTVLQVKLESLVKEETLKREYLEKDLRREFDMKMMQLNQGGH